MDSQMILNKNSLSSYSMQSHGVNTIWIIMSAIYIPCPNLFLQLHIA